VELRGARSGKVVVGTLPWQAVQPALLVGVERIRSAHDSDQPLIFFFPLSGANCVFGGSFGGSAFSGSVGQQVAPCAWGTFHPVPGPTSHR
jgi:hypothetical protein